MIVHVSAFRVMQRAIEQPSLSNRVQYGYRTNISILLTLEAVLKQTIEIDSLHSDFKVFSIASTDHVYGTSR